MRHFVGDGAVVGYDTAVRDGRIRRWARRCITVPATVAGLVLVSAALPALLCAATLVDLARRSREVSTVRLALFAWCFLFTESVGLGLLLLTFLATLFRPRARAGLTFAVQRLYVAMHWGFTRRVFRLSSRVEGLDGPLQGPLLVLMRHASLVDVMLPAVFIANPHRLRLRYALKRELLWEPCLDIAGHWMPNHFVARGGADTASDVAGVRALKDGLGGQDGVLLFPEGTRFTAERRVRALEKLPAGSPQRAAAERLRHLLPIRPGGILALLDAPPPCDVLFVGHHGLEGLSHLASIWRGGLVGRTVHLRFWRERAADIPEDAGARLAWLAERWERLDRWLDEVETHHA